MNLKNMYKLNLADKSDLDSGKPEFIQRLLPLYEQNNSLREYLLGKNVFGLSETHIKKEI